jgi:hypothetical protein
MVLVLMVKSLECAGLGNCLFLQHHVQVRDLAGPFGLMPKSVPYEGLRSHSSLGHYAEMRALAVALSKSLFVVWYMMT